MVVVTLGIKPHSKRVRNQLIRWSLAAPVEKLREE